MISLAEKVSWRSPCGGGGAGGGAGAGDNRTDNTGLVAFDLLAGDYIVTSDLAGTNWGTLRDAKGQPNVTVHVGQQTTLHIRRGKLTITAATTERGIGGQGFTIRLQRKDANGNIVSGDDVFGDRTDNTGTVAFALNPGHYIVASDFRGYNWGDLRDGKGAADVVVKAGEEARLDIRLGRIRVVTLGADGQVLSGQGAEVLLQRLDATGKPVLGDSIDGGRSDNTGVWQTDLTAGTYALRSGSQTIFNIVVKPGEVTEIRP